MCMYVIYFSYVYILDDLRVYISLRVYIRSIHVDTAISLRLQKLLYMYVDVWISTYGGSWNRGIPQSSILMGCSLINQPFWGTPISGNLHIYTLPLDDRRIGQTFAEVLAG